MPSKTPLTLCACLCCAVWLMACGHTSQVQDASKADEQTQPEKAKPAPAANAASSTPKRDSDRQKESPSSTQVPVASAPSALLADGAATDIQRKLQNAGFLDKGDKHITGKWDPATERAFRRFQRDNDLPETGMPDRASAEALGVDPDELFKRAKENDGER